MEVTNVVKVIIPAVMAFGVGLAITPIITHFLYKYKVWKKSGSEGKTSIDGTEATEFNKLHKDDELRVPRMGGIVIWASSVITILLLAILAKIFTTTTTIKLDLLSRDQTWILLITLVLGAIVGFANDLLDVSFSGKGMSLRRRLLFVVAMSSFFGWWFYSKLGITSISIPFDGSIEIGWLVIPMFIIMTLAIYASGIIDGIDGLSAGVFTSIFVAYGLIAFHQHQIDIASFCAMLSGSILAFLWFNIPPARFYMTETGTMAITLTLSTIAFMTDSMGGGIGISVLPIIGFLLVITVASNIIQLFSKKYRGKKLFRVAPIHHHFEAIGWAPEKVTMRYWILGIIFAFTGVIIAIIG